MMKRLTALLLTVVLLSLVGCTNQTNTDTEEDNTNVSETEGTETTMDNEKGYYTAEDYLADPSLFVPVWADEREVPAEMLDFEEKYASFMNPNGRLMSDAHRGEHKYYPEASIEAFLSAILAGIDIVEVDVAVTQDNVLVVMHDETISRTTNVELLRKQGVAGLPESNYVSDWTLAQLRRLRLMSTDGTEVTNYVIPTLEEVIMICNERCFITLDKDNRFEWYNDIIPLIEKHNAWRTVMLPYQYSYSLSPTRVKERMDYITEKSGYTSALMFRSNDSSCLAQTTKYIDEYGFPKVIRSGEYVPSDTPNYTPYVNNYRVHIECLSGNDYLEAWKQIDAEGYGIIVTNDAIGLTEYIQETYFN